MNLLCLCCLQTLLTWTYAIIFESTQCWKLIWLTVKLWEEDFVPNQLLRHLCIESEILASTDKYTRTNNPKEFSILVTRRWLPKWKNDILYLQRFKTSGIQSYILIVIGDESHADEGKCSDEVIFTTIPLVIRNYWTHDCAKFPNILQAPLGVTMMFTESSNFNGTLQNIYSESFSIDQRKYVWTFSSSHTTVIRNMFVDHMKALTEEHPEYSHFMNYKRKARHMDIRELLMNSIFAVCPEGQVPETWRFYESLESGAIPVINRTTFDNYYQYILPCNITDYILVTEYPEIDIPILLSDRAELDRRRERLLTAYSRWRDQWRQLVATRINEVARLESNFSYEFHRRDDNYTEGIFGERSPDNHVLKHSVRPTIYRNNREKLPWDYSSCSKSMHLNINSDDNMYKYNRFVFMHIS